jgi:hypothetical protein
MFIRLLQFSPRIGPEHVTFKYGSEQNGPHLQTPVYVAFIYGLFYVLQWVV